MARVWVGKVNLCRENMLGFVLRAGRPRNTGGWRAGNVRLRARAAVEADGGHRRWNQSLARVVRLQPLTSDGRNLQTVRCYVIGVPKESGSTVQ